MKRRKVLQIGGIGMTTLSAGCLGILRNEPNDDPDPPPQTTAPPTSTPPSDSSDRLALGGIGYPLEMSRESMDSAASLSHSLRIANASNMRYAAVFVEYGSDQNTETEWEYDLEPGEERIITRFDPDQENLQFSGMFVYPSLWSDSLPDSVGGNIPGSAEIPGGNGTYSVVSAEITGESVQIPIPSEMADADISDVNIQSFWGTEYIGDLSEVSIDDEYLQLPVESLSADYFGGNPYMLHLTGIKTEYLGILTFPVPTFSVADVDLTASTADGELVWENLSYELTVGEALVDKFQITHTVVRPEYPLGRAQTTVQSGTTNQVSVEGDWLQSLDLPVDTKEITLFIQTPYPVARTRTAFEVS